MECITVWFITDPDNAHSQVPKTDAPPSTKRKSGNSYTGNIQQLYETYHLWYNFVRMVHLTSVSNQNNQQKQYTRQNLFSMTVSFDGLLLFEKLLLLQYKFLVL